MSGHLNRRQMVRGSLSAAAGIAVAGGREAFAQLQMPAPQPLEDKRFSFVSTTANDAWRHGKVFDATFQWDQLNLSIDAKKFMAGSKPMQGFGGCFNELGWTALSALSEQDRQTVMEEIFGADGARFSYCRMPIGANDFATEAYSYDETDGDFELSKFSIDHDRKTLVPFIHAAQRYQPRLKLWASPWTPPSWMKRNHFYAETAGQPKYGLKDNGIRPDQVGREGQDMFIQEPRYFEAYARYFGRFIDAYKAEGIPVGMVMPQNEFNSPANYPSCTWTPEGLSRFVQALGPEMSRRDVEIFLGTVERGDPQIVDRFIANADAAKYVKGIGMQWAGKEGLPEVPRKYPELTIFQSELECGDGLNEWKYTSYCWELMKLYFRSGASGFMYWNIALDQTTKSSWGWPQNSLVTVDTVTKAFKYNHDYYLMKHLTHFVDAGARLLEIGGAFDDALAFVNPEGTVHVILRNELSRTQMVKVSVGARPVSLVLAPDSISTFTVLPV